ncbi:MAG TPA: hypothetical protein VFE08_12665, partial [Candidatus Sulfotelmatobacter sp.]|nr:hypothetical protein [Candidatus Sulfotelmatobacter sp.]
PMATILKDGFLRPWCCDVCEQQFEPMTADQRRWTQRLHLQSARHQRYVKLKEESATKPIGGESGSTSQPTKAPD